MLSVLYNSWFISNQEIPKRKKDRSDLGPLVLPELNRLKDLKLDHESNLWHSLQGHEGVQLLISLMDI